METIDLLNDDSVPWAETVKLNQSFQFHGGCIVTGETVPVATPTVKLCPPHDAGAGEATHYVSISAIDTLADRLERLPLDGTGRVELGERIYAVDGETLEWVRKHACVICREEIDRNGRFVAVDVDAGVDLVDAVLHPGCAAELVDALDRAWEHAPELLSSTL